MRKFLSSVILICACFFLESCLRQVDLRIVTVDPLEKILPEQNVFLIGQQEADVARGEQAAFQLAIRCNQPIKNLSIKFKGFTGSLTQEKRFSPHAKIYYVGNVHESRAQFDPGQDHLVSPSSFYPDPLLDDKSIDIDANVTTAVYLSIFIPHDIEPGVYKGQAVVRGCIQGIPFRKVVPLSLKVYTTIINNQTLNIANWHYEKFDYVDQEATDTSSSAWRRVMEEMAVLMKDYRQNAVLLSPLELARYTYDQTGAVSSIDFSFWGEVVQLFTAKGNIKWILGKHIAIRQEDWNSSFALLVPRLRDGKTYLRKSSINDPITLSFYKLFFKTLMTYLDKMNWSHIYLQHIGDEPTDENLDSYQQIRSMVQSIEPRIKVIEAIQTEHVIENIDVCVVPLNSLISNMAQTQKYKGKEIWYYTCILPQGNYANRYIRQPLIKTRLLPWINYKYNITGYLHWGFNYWMGNNPMLETTGIQTNGLALPAGDAWIVYPYKKHIIPSIRLEAMRDGIADYELLCLLQQKDSLKTQKIVNSIIYGIDRYDTDIAHFRRVRKQLLEALEKKD